MGVSNFSYSEAIGVESLNKVLSDSDGMVEVNAWREKFNEMYDTKNDGAKRKAFCIAKKKMVADGFITFKRRWLISVDRIRLNEAIAS